MLACLCNLLRNGATYGGDIVHVHYSNDWQLYQYWPNKCRTCVTTHGLGLMSIGVIIGKKRYFSKNAILALQRTCYKLSHTMGCYIHCKLH